MPRSLGTAIENNFTKGFLTEFSGLNFPENACVDVSNCVFTEFGEVLRRDSVDLEGDLIWRTVTGYSEGDSVVSYSWKSAGQSSDVNFLVFQVGSILHFFKDVKNSSLSDTSTYLTFDLDSYKVAGAPSTKSYPVCLSSGNNKLFIAHRYMQPRYIEFDEGTGTLSTTEISVQIRDFQVLEDGFDNAEEPLVSNNEHLYNLYNQGWNSSLVAKWKASNYNQEPAKTMIPWYFRRPEAGNGRGNYDFLPANRIHFPILGTSLAPRGQYIYDAFDIDRSTVSGISGLEGKSCGYERPSTSCFMNSRIFFSGISYEGYGGSVYFSNILKDTSNEIFFYQRGDPTSETTYELLSNDGGIIVIPEIDRIVHMISTKAYLLLFCTNGIWAISGSEGVGFTATDYMIEKVSDVPALTSSSIISVEHSPLWWNNDGIYTVSVENTGLSVVSLTKSTIQSYYDNIPNASKRYAVPIFNRLTTEVSWFFSSDGDTPTVFDSWLSFRASTKAFYKSELTPGTSSVVGVVNTTDRGVPKISEAVLDSLSDVVVDSSSGIVTVEVNGNDNTDAVFTFFLVYDSDSGSISFANFIPDGVIDWVSDGNIVPFESYLVTGYRTRGDAIRKFQVQYINVFSRSVENSSCKMSGRWDYAIDEMSNGFTTEQEVCVNNPYRSVTWRKLRLRGTGYTLQLRFRSNGGAPFHLIGWSAQEVSNDKA